MTHKMGTLLLASAGLAAMGFAGAVTAQSVTGFAEQAERGRQTYAVHCAMCHGGDLAGGQFAGALKGGAFLDKWGGVPAAELFDYIHRSMPPGGSSALGEDDYADLTALILSENGAVSEAAMGFAGGQLTGPQMPAAPAGEQGNELGIGGITDRYPFPAAPEAVDRFANYSPVTEAMLSDPAPENWLSWRRGHEGQGYSPLAQITPENIATMQVAWSQALPPGATMNEPLVRDGVLYVFGFGDSVFAFDAANGRQLWRYDRRLPDDVAPLSKKTIALYGDKLYVATSDNALVAFDARSGRPIWDVKITDRSGMRSNGGPLAADGVIMAGLATQEPGGGIIAAFDAETGDHLWTFDTVAKTGTEGGDTWNRVPDEERRGGSVWTSGTYDAETGLALWGVAQTYDTGPYRDALPGANNDGLFTNSTLAFVPRTGELKWYYQHVPNDQYDLDWVFERVIGDLDVNGERRHVVMTGGKEGLFDTLDAATGEYISTADMGFQDFITQIDPVTGRKSVDPSKIPGRDRDSVFMCPHAGGGRNWSPTSFDEASGTLFVNARDTCMELRPVTEGGFLTSGVNVYYSAPADSDGNFGFVQAIDMATGEVKWETRRRAPYDMGMLATASGLLFTGGMDGDFLAYRQDDGAQIWRSALTGVPNGSPITYAVDGKQYIAVVTGAGNPLSFGLPGFTPELPTPAVPSAAVTVFALPE
ncbi:PQQ-binding-like beta-propeller repeat protein [Aurantiacibacter suaedae]|uniref:outer membrane protein assembly factor BamB family protein n=1 Tax=Aurantiacibacter suaedae TaxID=2545755 RepID=UPI0010F79E9E|nr:PQQ-binding-like beta-propeller repeat protein [Aurantiacibacter suaedae]